MTSNKMQTNKMNMKSIAKMLILLPVAALSLISCNKNGSDINYQSYMTAVETTGQEYSCYFISDDYITVIPVNNLSILSTFKTNDRVLATFTIPAGEITDPVEVEFSAISKLQTEHVVTSSQPDTLGTDKIDIENAWHSGGVDGLNHFLTIAYAYNLSGSGKAHDFTLVDNTSVLTNPDKDGYYHLYLTHNSHGDHALMRTTAVSTFYLDQKFIQPGIKGIRIDYAPLASDSDRSSVTVDF